jgi:hypothetical protein
LGPMASPMDELLVRIIEPPRRQFVTRNEDGTHLWLVGLALEVLP